MREDVKFRVKQGSATPLPSLRVCRVWAAPLAPSRLAGPLPPSGGFLSED